jgi:PAS domain-containing protein
MQTGELGTLGSYLQVSPLPTIIYRSSVERIASVCPFDLDRPPTLVNPAFQTVFKSESFKSSTHLRSWDGFVSHVERLVNRWYASRRNGGRTIPNEIIRTDSVKAGTRVDGYFGLNGESGKDNLSKTEWNASIISSDDKSSTLLVLTLTPESLARMTTLQPAHSSSSPGTRTRHRKLPSEILKASNEFGIVLPEREDEVDGEEDGRGHAQNVPVETTSDEHTKPTDPLEPIPLGSSATYYTEQTHLVPGVSAKVHPSVLSRFALAAPVGMVLATTSARIIWANDEWFKVVGLKRGDPFDSWIDLVDPAYVPLMLNTLGDVMEERLLTNIQLKWKDGRWANFTTQCDYDENGTFIGLMGTIIDVTQRREAELAEIDNLVKKEAEARKMAEEMIERSRQLAEANTKNQELQRQRNMLAKMAEVSTTGLTIAYPNGTIRWGNQAYYEMHGLNAQNKDEWERIIVPTDLEKLKSDFAE